MKTLNDEHISRPNSKVYNERNALCIFFHCQSHSVMQKMQYYYETSKFCMTVDENNQRFWLQRCKNNTFQSNYNKFWKEIIYNLELKSSLG